MINETTLRAIETASHGNSHAILLSGLQGAGKGYAAQILCSIKLGMSDHKQLENYPYFKHVQPINNKITVDQIRGIKEFFKLKSIGTNKIRRAVIIEDSQLMNLESQNALLKSLEEPPDDTMIVLTATPTESLKQTIKSRVQVINVLPLTNSDVIEMLGNNLSTSEKQKYFMMSGGLAGLLYKLSENQSHELIDQIELAKKILGNSKFERLSIIDKSFKDKANLAIFAQALKIISISAITANANKNNPKGVFMWRNIASLAYKCEEDLKSNPNAKLLATNLMLKM